MNETIMNVCHAVPTPDYFYIILVTILCFVGFVLIIMLIKMSVDNYIHNKIHDELNYHVNKKVLTEMEEF